MGMILSHIPEIEDVWFVQPPAGTPFKVKRAVRISDGDGGTVAFLLEREDGKVTSQPDLSKFAYANGGVAGDRAERVLRGLVKLGKITSAQMEEHRKVVEAASDSREKTELADSMLRDLARAVRLGEGAPNYDDKTWAFIRKHHSREVVERVGYAPRHVQDKAVAAHCYILDRYGHRLGLSPDEVRAAARRAKGEKT